MADTMSEMLWLRSLLIELNFPPPSPMKMYFTRHAHTHTRMSTYHMVRPPHVATWRRSAMSVRGNKNPFFILFNHFKIGNSVK